MTKLTLIELWIYCHRNRTNGLIPAAQAHHMVHKRVREVLTAAGCWHQRPCSPSTPCVLGACSASAPCGREVYVLHDYDKHQLRYPTNGAPARDDPARDRRPYIKLAVDFLDNYRTGPLSPVAKLALIELWVYCHTNRTNGVVPISVFRRIANPRIRAMLLDAGSCHHYADTAPSSRRHHATMTPTPRRHEDGSSALCRHDGGVMVASRWHGDGTTAASCRHGVVIMHDYEYHQTPYPALTDSGEKASSEGEYDTTSEVAENREPHPGEGRSPARVTRASPARASRELEVIDTSGTHVGIPPPVGNARGEIHPDAPSESMPPMPPPGPPPTVRLAPRARHGGDGVADRLNAAVPEVPATPAMRQRVLARLAPNAVAVLADPDSDPIRRERARDELARAEAVIDARAEYLKTGDLAENPDADLLFDRYGDNGAMRRMMAAQRPLPVPDPVTVGERRAMAFRLARDHIDTLTGHGARPPGKAREALRAELEALLDAGVSQDVLRSELRAMLEVGLWAASKLRERLSEART
ncbi:hypothetical protein ACWEKT_02905 [Nocardia takedensis]